MVEGLLLSLPKRPDILAIQLAASFILLVLLAGVMFLVSPLQVAVSVAAILTVIYFFTRPTIALFSIFCIRGLLDLLWWIPGTIAGLNMLQLFSAAAFCLVATQLFLDLKRMQEHPLFQMFLAYLVFIIIGTLRSDNILANLDNIVRYTSPFILFFMVSIYLDKRELRRSLLFFIACIGMEVFVAAAFAAFIAFIGMVATFQARKVDLDIEPQWLMMMMVMAMATMAKAFLKSHCVELIAPNR